MKILEGFGMLIGVVIGAGLFGLPASFSKAPLHWNLALFAGVFLLSLLLHYLLASIVYITPGKHRFPGYVQKYLGQRAETIATIFTILSSYGAMLAYGVLGALFLQNIFGISFLAGGVAFFILGGFLFFLSLQEVGKINFYLTLPLLAFILILAAKLFPHIHGENFLAAGERSWFLAYGILVFAFGGYSALPDLHDILGHASRLIFKRIIFWTLFVSGIFYLIFIFSVLGVAGKAVTQEALSGLGSYLGRGVAVIGSLIGIFTVFRAYVGFGSGLKLMLHYDYNISKRMGWLLAFLPPVLLFLTGFVDLVEILSIVGSVGLGIFAVFILLMAWKKKNEVSAFLGFTPRAWWLLPLGILIVLGALQDIISVYF